MVDADEVYYLEAQGDETDVRLRAARRLRDVRSLGEVMKELGPLGFVRVHRNHAVNPGRVREIRPSGSGWEARLESPVNKVLPRSPGPPSTPSSRPIALPSPTDSGSGPEAETAERLGGVGECGSGTVSGVPTVLLPLALPLRSHRHQGSPPQRRARRHACPSPSPDSAKSTSALGAAGRQR